MSPATIIVLAVLVAAVALIVFYFVRKKKKGEHICSCGGNCSACGLCSQNNPTQDE